MRGVNAVALMATLALAAFGEFAGPAGAQAPAVTAFEGARLIVGNGRPSIENATVVVEGTKITQAGAAVDVRVPEGAARVNLAGKTIMPTLIDTHTHLSQTREGLIQDLKRRAYYGVSAALSMGTAETENELQMRGETTPGMARVFTAWRGITRPEPGRSKAPFWIDTEADGRKAVQELAAHKVDIVKIWVDDRDGKYPKLTPALYGAVIDEAHKNGLRVTAHIFTLEDGKGLLRAGVDAFAHSVRDKDVDEAFVAMMKRRDVCYCPTLMREVSTFVYDSTPPWFSDPLFLKHADRAAVEQLKEPARQEQMKTSKSAKAYKAGLEVANRNLKKLSDSGVKIAMGTDTGPPARFQGYFELMELEMEAKAGLTPRQVLASATRDAARCQKLDAQVGTLEANKWADFVVLNGDPLADVSNVRKIEDVYIAGNRVER